MLTRPSWALEGLQVQRQLPATIATLGISGNICLLKILQHILFDELKISLK
jgi:hypothetical protein